MFMLTESEIEQWKQKIDEMTQMECAELQRFAPSGHPVFRSDSPLYEYFQAHFKSLGGMTPEISKAIGYGR
jgi:hypothetical protein